MSLVGESGERVERVECYAPRTRLGRLHVVATASCVTFAASELDLAIQHPVCTSTSTRGINNQEYSSNQRHT